MDHPLTTHVPFMYYVATFLLLIYCRKSMVYPDKREFAREIWNKWFDHTFPPTPAESDWEEDEEEEEEVVEAEEDKEDRWGRWPWPLTLPV